jgi:hypothetical protein
VGDLILGMQNDFSKYFPILFPFFFVGMWLLVTTSLARKAGWPDLSNRYPNRDEQPVRVLRFQSGWMGGVSMSSILRLEACPSGLRVGILKMFGLFSRDFFVPWNEIRIQRKTRFIWNIVELDLGGVGKLSLFDYAANKLARSVSGAWPEQGSFPKDTIAQALWQVSKAWLFGALFVVGFFTLVPLLLSGGKHAFPFPNPIIFPAIIMISVAGLIYFWARIRD